ncbi:hypothetical protein ACFUGD_01200 [Streptomyces sp. NPDC057217]|uniref:hypothetical protein n=1 Tax=Streptomyces sp. NPDC057217 TaxID=3346054 RepID=UPI00363E8691
MKQRIEFTAFVDVDRSEPLSPGDARRWVIDALFLGDRHAELFTTVLEHVTSVSTVGDNE